MNKNTCIINTVDFALQHEHLSAKWSKVAPDDFLHTITMIKAVAKVTFPRWRYRRLAHINRYLNYSYFAQSHIATKIQVYIFGYDADKSDMNKLSTTYQLLPLNTAALETFALVTMK